MQYAHLNDIVEKSNKYNMEWSYHIIYALKCKVERYTFTVLTCSLKDLDSCHFIYVVVPNNTSSSYYISKTNQITNNHVKDFITVCISFPSKW